MTGVLNANKDITQNIMITKAFKKDELLFEILEEKINISENPRTLPKTIIFVGRKYSCDELTLELRKGRKNSYLII